MRYTFVLFIVVISLGCEQLKDCELIEEVEHFTIQFYDRDTASLTEEIAVFSVTPAEADRLSILSDDIDIALHEISLLVNPFDTAMSFYFNTDLGKDTLRMAYNSWHQIYSEECDPVRIFHLDTLNVYHTFDSLKIQNGALSKTTDVNIKIFID